MHRTVDRSGRANAHEWRYVKGRAIQCTLEATQGEFVEAFRNQLLESANASDDPSIEAAGGFDVWE